MKSDMLDYSSGDETDEIADDAMILQLALNKVHPGGDNPMTVRDSGTSQVAERLGL